MAAIVNVNGRIVPEREATISVFDHGFLYGEGVYEVLRTYRGKPFLLDRHLGRLERSAGAIALPLPLDRLAFGARIAETIAAIPVERPGESEYYLRVILTRGVGDMGYDPALCPEPTLLIIAKELMGDRPVPAWMQVVPSTMRILIHQLPERAQIDTQVTEQLIVELYSK